MSVKYSPVPSLISSLFFFSFPFVLAWDMGRLHNGFFPFAAQALNSLGWAWLASFVERLAGDHMTLGMLIALAILGIYGILQYLGTALDRRLLKPDAKDAGSGIKALRKMTGRPKVFPVQEMTKEQVLDIHFGHGRNVLLSPLRFGLWAFPVIGFLGTVIGISGAVGRLPQVLEDSQQLNLLLSNLHTAFDTTFAGLAASVIIMIFMTLIEGRWDRNELPYVVEELAPAVVARNNDARGAIVPEEPLPQTSPPPQA